jgi:hypothetical protein
LSLEPQLPPGGTKEYPAIVPLVVACTLTNTVAEVKPGPEMRTSWLSRVETSIPPLSYVTVNEYDVPPAAVTFVVVAIAVG